MQRRHTKLIDRVTQGSISTQASSRSQNRKQYVDLIEQSLTRLPISMYVLLNHIYICPSGPLAFPGTGRVILCCYGYTAQHTYYTLRSKQGNWEIFVGIFLDFNFSLQLTVNFQLVYSGIDNLHIGQLSRHFFFWQATILRLTQITPWGWIFGPRFFII